MNLKELFNTTREKTTLETNYKGNLTSIEERISDDGKRSYIVAIQIGKLFEFIDMRELRKITFLDFEVEKYREIYSYVAVLYDFKFHISILEQELKKINYYIFGCLKSSSSYYEHDRNSNILIEKWNGEGLNTREYRLIWSDYKGRGYKVFEGVTDNREFIYKIAFGDEDFSVIKQERCLYTVIENEIFKRIDEQEQEKNK